MSNVIVQGFLADPAIITQGYTPSMAFVLYTGAAYQDSPTAVQFAVNAATGFLGTNPAITVAAGDSLSIDLLVELA